MLVNPLVVETARSSVSSVYKKPYFFSRVPIPIQLKPFYKTNQNYLFFLVLNTEIRIREYDGVLDVNLIIYVLGDFRLPPNFLILDVSSNIGEFNNINLNQIGVERRKIGQHETKITSFLANFKVNLNDIGYAKKEVINKEILFEPHISLNSNINAYEEQIDFNNWSPAMVYEEILDSMKNWNFKYIYKNIFNLRWTPSHVQKLNYELFSKPFLGFKFNGDELYRVIDSNQKIKKLFNLYAYEHDVQVKDLKEAQINYELEYKSLFNNEPKKLKWVENINSIVQTSTGHILEIQNKFKYDYNKDELIIDNVNGFNGIWLPNSGNFLLKTAIIANTVYGRQILKNDIEISVIHDFFRKNNVLASKIKVKRAVIKNYENFKNTKN